MDVSVIRDLLATLLSASLAYVLVKTLEFSASQDYLSQLVCRKVVHISTGPLFVLTWPLFSTHCSGMCRSSAAMQCIQGAPDMPTIHSAVGCCICRLILVAIGTMESKATIQAVSRGGSRQELLRGPLLYIGIVTAVTLLFWRESPVGLMVLSLMCGGDGLADIVGRRYGSARLPFNHNKSWLGSLAMLTGGAVMSMVYIALFHSMGYFTNTMQNMLGTIWMTSLVATAVEALPIYGWLDDNLTTDDDAEITIGGTCNGQKRNIAPVQIWHTFLSRVLNEPGNRLKQAQCR
ncbi:hypothetical protein WJX82_002228 [Trebouxia sp. C0006]